jgi:hypothetical protein
MVRLADLDQQTPIYAAGMRAVVVEVSLLVDKKEKAGELRAKRVKYHINGSMPRRARRSFQR